MSEIKYLTVSALNRYIAYKLDSDIALKVVYIKGEVSNARVSKGHLYFVLKDEESEISAIIFQNVLRNLKYLPKDGAKVLICGSVTSYAKKGGYNLIVSSIQEFGQGLIYQQFLELKEKLEKEGLFDSAHKKKIPEYPERIAVVTSDTGDALQDILSTIKRRYPIAKVFLYQALVQGADAPKSLIAAFKKVDSDNLAEVVIIARGGGSIEDLSCFNDEELARTIYDLNMPIVSGVGHENDYTICDFVSDDRAPTPTGAAVRVTPDKAIILENIKANIDKLKSAYNQNINNYQNKLELLTNNHYFKNFGDLLEEKTKEVNHLIDKLNSFSPNNVIIRYEDELKALSKRLELYNFSKKIDDLSNDLDNNVLMLKRNYLNIINNLENSYDKSLDKLILVNPLNIMKKGYTLVYKDDVLITKSKELKKDDIVDIVFHDGKVKANIK